jgi:lysosomal acid lipase/cholesteryl ester hydrolase
MEEVGIDKKPLDDKTRTIPELISSRGFSSETHFVTTPDNYILAVYRILDLKSAAKKRPVLLWHGLLCSGRDWIITDDYTGYAHQGLKPVGNNMGFELAKRGYDVWLANGRGNSYSMNHTKYHPQYDHEFWDFSQDDFIEADLPTVIQYILKKTNSKTLSYVGFSQGTLIMFGLLSSRPAYNQIIKPFIALAPVTAIRSVNVIMGTSFFLVGSQEKKSYKSQFPPNNQALDMFKSIACSELQEACSRGALFSMASDSKHLNDTRMPVYLAGLPSPTSTKVIVHISQNQNAGKFRKFDYGGNANLGRYGSSDPPLYDIAKITNPHIALFSSKGDKVATSENIEFIRRTIRTPLIMDVTLPDTKWSHIDFILGQDQGKIIIEPVIKILDKYKNT